MALSLSELVQERKNKVSNLDPYAVGSMLANQGPMAMEQGLGQQIQSGNPFGIQGSDLIGDRASQIYNQRLGNVKSSILRNAVFADADKDAMNSQVVDAYKAQKDQEWLLEQQRKAAKKAKKKGFGAALGGLLGAGAGAFVGGPAGAQVGAGFGSYLGGS